MGNYCCLREIKLDKSEQTFTKQNIPLNIPQIVKIQSAYRRYKTQKTVTKMVNDDYKQKVIEQLNAYSSSMLNFNSRNFKCFDYKKDDETDLFNHLKEFRGPVTLENKAVYFGEWQFNNYKKKK